MKAPMRGGGRRPAAARRGGSVGLGRREKGGRVDGGAGVGVWGAGGLWVAGGRRVNTSVSLWAGCGAAEGPGLVWSH